jgi:spoIIIJ-associated protein
MSNSIESQAKTVDEAISEALLKLGARRDEVEVTILQEGKSGLLGIFGGKPARVLVERKAQPRAAVRTAAPSRERSKPRQPQASDQRRGGGRQRRPEPQDKPLRARERRPAASRPAAAEKVPDGNTLPGVKAVTLVEPLRGVPMEEAPAVLRKLTEELMRRSSFPCRCEIKEGDYHLVKIVTDDNSAGVLIGRHGTTIDAVEHLIERMASQAVGERVNMNLDINNYRRRREEALIERTQGIIEKVRSTGREVHLEPLCARERRIIHLEVVKAEGLRTYTIATSSGKHVVVAKAEPGQDRSDAGDDFSDDAAGDFSDLGNGDAPAKPTSDEGAFDN